MSNLLTRHPREGGEPEVGIAPKTPELPQVLGSRLRGNDDSVITGGNS